MKKLICINTEITNEGKKLTTFDLLKVVLNTPKAEGLPVLEMKSRIEVLTLIDKSINKEIELNDDQVKMIKPLVEKYGWTIVHKDLVEFGDTIAKL